VVLQDKERERFLAEVQVRAEYLGEGVRFSAVRVQMWQG
jgi:hypothetical protein